MIISEDRSCYNITIESSRNSIVFSIRLITLLSLCTSDGQPALTFSSSSGFLGESGDHSTRSIMLI